MDARSLLGSLDLNPWLVSHRSFVIHPESLVWTNTADVLPATEGGGGGVSLD